MTHINRLRNTEKLVVACDIDDVKFPFVPRFCEFHNRAYGTNMSLSDFHVYSFGEVMGVSKEESLKRIDEEYLRSEEFLTAEPMAGSEDAIEHLASDFRVIDVTARRDNYKPTTHRWVEHFFPQVERVHFSQNHYVHAGDRISKAQICLENGAQFLIEDSGDYALQVADAGVSVYLFDQPWNQGVEHGIITRIPGTGKGHWDNLLDAVYRDV